MVIPTLRALVIPAPALRRPDSLRYTPPGMSPPSKILVVQPSWVGDAVMATPTVRALRERLPAAHVSYLMRRYVKPVYAGTPWADQLMPYRPGTAKPNTGR